MLAGMILILGGSQELSAHRAHLLPFCLSPAGAGAVTGRELEPGSLEHCFPRHGCLHCSLITGAQILRPQSASASVPLHPSRALA